MLIKERGTNNNSKTSYGYKHMLEKSFSSGYIANGAFIQAATELRMSVKRLDQDSLNAVFKFTVQDLNLALMNYCIKKQNISIPYTTKETIKEQFVECQSKSKKIPVGILSDLYKHFKVDVGIKELFLIMNDAGIKIKHDFGKKIENANNELFGDESTVNISLSKLSKLLHNEFGQEREVLPIKSEIRFHF